MKCCREKKGERCFFIISFWEKIRYHMVIKPSVETDNKSPFPKSLQSGEGKKNGFVCRGDKWSFHIQKCFIFAWIIAGLSKSSKTPHVLALGTESLCQKSSFLKSLGGCIWTMETRSRFRRRRPRPRSLAVAALGTPQPLPPWEPQCAHVSLLAAHQSDTAFRWEQGHASPSVEVETNSCEQPVLGCLGGFFSLCRVFV